MNAIASPTVEPKEKQPAIRKRWFAYFGANSLALSIFLHALFGVGATFLIVEHFQKKHVNFHATEPPSAHTEVEHKVQLAKRNNVESAPPDLKRIVSTDASPITLPEPPEIPTTDTASPSPMSDVDGLMGVGMGSGAGQGGGGGGGSPLFGAPNGMGFVGDFYDMKQSADQQPNVMANNAFEEANPGGVAPGWQDLPATKEEIQVLRSYVVDFNSRILDDYYQAPVSLSIPQVFIPEIPAELAPKAFGVEKTVQPRRWIVHYRAKIVPPTTGDFRFIGFADDYMVVRIDRQNVLDASWDRGILDSHADVQDNVGMAPRYTGRYGGQLPLRCGQWVHMEAGIAMDMQVVIGEGPGGQSAFFLMIQQKGVDYPPGDYPVFQLDDVDFPHGDNRETIPPAFSGKKMIFGVDSK